MKKYKTQQKDLKNKKIKINQFNNQYGKDSKKNKNSEQLLGKKNMNLPKVLENKQVLNSKILLNPKILVYKMFLKQIDQLIQLMVDNF